MSDLTVAKTILAQLGANMFKAMTGAKNFIGSDDGLSFQFPNRKGANRCSVKLTSMDLYDVEFARIRCRKGIPERKVMATHNGIYADQLRSIFTSETGLYTSL